MESQYPDANYYGEIIEDEEDNSNNVKVYKIKYK